MSAAARQNKNSRKPGPEPAGPRRTSAWGSGARASPTFQPANGPARQQQSASPAPPPAPPSFPPLAQQSNGARPDNSRDRVLQSLSGLTGTTITLLAKTGQRYEGVIGSTTAEGDTTGVTLKDVKEITNPGAPLKDTLFIASTNIDTWSSGPADAKPTNGDSFRTDTDISQKRGLARERELQAWAPAPDANASGLGDVGSTGGDDDTFGANANGSMSWDQFTANEKLFGVKASFDEDVYTTKLDRSAPDFKERERRAQRLANEIVAAATSNPHVAEERGLAVDDSGVNEEDKYGAVVRGTNAYLPPARRTAGPPTQASGAAPEPKAEIPKVSINGPDGAPAAPVDGKTTSPTPAGAATNKPPADPLPAFRDFVTNEKQRLTQKRQALVKSEMDKRMAELVKFSQSFKLNKPIPDDLVPILAKDEDKQRAIMEKAKTDAASGHARAIGPSTPATASRGVAVAGVKMSKPVTQALPNKAAAGSNGVVAAPGASSGQKQASPGTTSSTPTVKPVDAASSKKISMIIQSIPPFKGGKGKTPAISTGSSVHTTTNGSTTTANANGAVRTSAGASPSIGASNGNGNGAPISPNTAAANRLNVNASSFRPNPKANAFNHVAASPKPTGATANTVSPKPKPESAPGPPNPFFGARPIKKSTPVHVKDDFNPFKHNKVVDASQVAAMWPYSGKRYMQMFPPPQHPPAQQPSHMVPPIPPPIPPPSYEEDSAAQAAAASRGYVYAYPPYGYPPPHMMQGMAPPGPPGAYMPGPYMQAMPYPPGMPPPNAMYSPAMGQMPPPGAYMPPPPPGAYPPPPPNGAGPRPSMPPTPIPSHAHPYYHQSPQLQHAYPMMMAPPPPNMPPHGYEGGPAPPVPMGGHS